MPGNQYSLGERIGAGGVAEVFRADIAGTRGFERTVAVKRVLPRWSADPRYAELFANEARIMAALHHPNVVAVSDFARDSEGRLLLAMELVDGVDLGRLARTGPVPIPVAIYIASELLRGLDHVHEHTDASGSPLGLVHRDLSANNVLVSREGAVKISDFGLAKACAGTRAGSDDDAANGTPCYMSPEQVQGGTLDRRSDLFAAGVILYELLTGTRPFAGADRAMIVVATLRQPIEPPRTMRPEIPADLDAITMHLLARDRAQRPKSAAAVIDALDRCEAASHLGRKQLIALLRERFPASGANAGAKPSHHAQARRRTKTVPARAPAPRQPRTRARNRARWAWAAGLALLAISATSSMLPDQDTQDTNPAPQSDSTRAAPRTDGPRAIMPPADTGVPRSTPVTEPPEEPAPAAPTRTVEQRRPARSRTGHAPARRPAGSGDSFPYFFAMEPHR